MFFFMSLNNILTVGRLSTFAKLNNEKQILRPSQNVAESCYGVSPVGRKRMLKTCPGVILSCYVSHNADMFTNITTSTTFLLQLLPLKVMLRWAIFVVLLPTFTLQSWQSAVLVIQLLLSRGGNIKSRCLFLNRN